MTWDEYALCKGLDEIARLPDKQHPMFERYEASPLFAKVIDEMCMSCPVQKQCMSEGITSRQSGVWGGVYLHRGEIDSAKNEHKSESIWDELRKLYE